MPLYTSSNQGKVYLVGAGPGDPGLITVRGAQLLEEAEAVIYDRLANPKLLAMTPDESEHIYVGKRPGRPSASQTQINHILVTKAREGKKTIRLKGGDAFIFGRGGEECEALRAAGVPFEVVPGISSALAAPACAGIPLTYRGLARSFTVITGHTIAKDNDFESLRHIADADVLVVLMGVRNMEAIATRLIQLGRDASTPAAVIEKATFKDQNTVVATLGTIAYEAADVSPPATFVVGDIVSLSHDINWFNSQPVVEEESVTPFLSNIAG